MLIGDAMLIDTLQLNHTHSFLLAHICVEWIDANVARDTSARDKFRLLDIMLPFANYNLAMDEDGLPKWQTLRVVYEPLDFVTCELGFKHEQH